MGNKCKKENKLFLNHTIDVISIKNIKLYIKFYISPSLQRFKKADIVFFCISKLSTKEKNLEGCFWDYLRKVLKKC